jgi:hypothetical protein
VSQASTLRVSRQSHNRKQGSRVRRSPHSQKRQTVCETSALVNRLLRGSPGYRAYRNKSPPALDADVGFDPLSPHALWLTHTSTQPPRNLHATSTNLLPTKVEMQTSTFFLPRTLRRGKRYFPRRAIFACVKRGPRMRPGGGLAVRVGGRRRSESSTLWLFRCGKWRVESLCHCESMSVWCFRCLTVDLLARKHGGCTTVASCMYDYCVSIHVADQDT